MASPTSTRRRMMVIGLHERISGHASRVRVLDRILTRLRNHDVWWPRKDRSPSGSSTIPIPPPGLTATRTGQRPAGTERLRPAA
jgi:hypothetical protein